MRKRKRREWRAVARALPRAPLFAAVVLFAPLVALAGAPPVIPPLVPVASAAPAHTRFHDWAISCAGGCHAFTRLRSEAPGAPEVLRLSVAPAGEGVFAVTLRTPAPLYLPAPLVLAPDRGDPVEVPWFTCGPRGCEARLTAGDGLIDALRAGRSANVELTLRDGAQVRLRLSLRGLTAALGAVARLDAAKPARTGEAAPADQGPAPPVSP